MKLLEQQIAERGKVYEGGVLSVGSFVNHNMDVKLLCAMADEIAAHFAGKRVDKVLTVEASGIALAVLVAERMNCEVVFAKKSKSLNAKGEAYEAECRSFTRPGVNVISLPKQYLAEKTNVLIIDDFLAVGNAANALIDIVGQAKANLVGMSVAIEKGFQGGGDALRKSGVDLLSLAIVESMEDGKITFRNN
ncbi:MAG: xanthine phosphoribosyltransferase [Candidatus Neoclostridium sp.]